jgi:hypothetical protein
MVAAIRNGWSWVILRWAALRRQCFLGGRALGRHVPRLRARLLRVVAASRWAMPRGVLCRLLQCD